MKRKLCCFCKKELEKKYHNGELYWDSGNNAEPLKKGRCCDKCNMEIVLPTRIMGLRNDEGFEK